MPHPAGYARAQIVLHWSVFILISAQYLFHEKIAKTWDLLRDGGDVAFEPLVALHVLVGIAVGAMMLWRLTLRLAHGAPPPPAHEPRPLRIAATVAHWAFYAVILVMVGSGLAAWFGGVGGAADVHGLLKPVLLLLVLLHVAAVAYHRVVLRESVMGRMIRPG